MDSSSSSDDSDIREIDNYHDQDDDEVEETTNQQPPPTAPPPIFTSKVDDEFNNNTSLLLQQDTTQQVHRGDEKDTLGVGGGADETFVLQAAMQDLHQPTLEANLRPGILSVPLLRHQKIALAWMLSKESSGLCLGGILADDQGLGKTVSMIALILKHKLLEESKKRKPATPRTQSFNLDDDESEDLTVLSQSSNTMKGFRSKRPTAGTLIVCPASVLQQWARELDEKVADKARFSVLIYHGGNRTKSPFTLAKYNVVVTTYAIVMNEVPKQPLVEEDALEEQNIGSSSSVSPMEKKRKKISSKKGKKVDTAAASDCSNCGTVARVAWARVVLDECQIIKNHRTQVARACCSLRAKRRWCLSGTPIQNSVDELFSYFRFLKYAPYDKSNLFASSIKAPIARDSVKGYQKLQIVLRNIMLRRTKGMLLDGEPIINLPPKKVHLMKVDFSTEERAFYNKLEAESRQQFKAYAAAGTLNQNYANILLLLLRLRQACDHPLLVKGLSCNRTIGGMTMKMLPRELLVNLLKQLEASMAICVVCRDPPENAVVGMCGHVFCYQCVSDYLIKEDNTCPAPECKEQLGADVVYSRPALQRCIMSDDDDVAAEVDSSSASSCEGVSDKSIVLQSDYMSSKIKAVLQILCLYCISEKQMSEPRSRRGVEKAIVFSQWTSMLDLVESSLKDFCINYRRLDGTMSLPSRDKAVKEFNSDPEVDVMLMSLKAGNLGLNMVAASRIILLDLWWNPTTEDQAIDRAHRIGQTRPVTVSRLTVKDTVEDRILALQEEKRKMIASAFGDDKNGSGATRLTVEDLRFLFEGR